MGDHSHHMHNHHSEMDVVSSTEMPHNHHDHSMHSGHNMMDSVDSANSMDHSVHDMMSHGMSHMMSMSVSKLFDSLDLYWISSIFVFCVFLVPRRMQRDNIVRTMDDKQLLRISVVYDCYIHSCCILWRP
jgi:hypothetical protein